MGLELLLSEALQHATAAAEAAPARVDVWMIPLLPVFGFVFQVFVGRRLPKPVPGFVACATVIASAALSWMLFRELRGMDPHHRAIAARLGDWIRVPGLDGALAVVADHKLVVDPLTAVMILVITNIGSLIHIYSLGYMAEEKRYARYFAYLNLFTGFMLILVMASNLILMFVGWEGVGLCSYLLIGFWYEKKENALAGMKAFIVNRVGDLAFTIGALTLFVYLGRQFGIWTVDFAEIGAAIGKHKAEFSGGVATFVAVMLFIGATGKSAQLPLYTWLPDAMAGPTPVSALIHAATMVTAGVYMIARMNFLYALSPTAMAVVATVGAATALFAGTIGIAQNDIKKVLAYSTVSQLGFMFMGVGVGAFAAGIFHLFTHAFFKACLFLGSGSVIHGMGGEQDIRKMGALRSRMPWTWATFGLATLAIAGLPPFAGFFSKDEILWQAWNTHAFSNAWGKVIWLTGVVAAACTAFYMMRLVLKTFHGRAQWQQATAFSGGGVDLPDWLNEEEEKKKKAGEPGKPKDGKGAEGLPAWMDDPHGQSLPQDESLLDLGSIKKKPEPEPPPADDHGHAHDLPQDESLLDLGRMSASAPHDEHAPAGAAPPSDPHAHDDARAHADARDGHGHDAAGGHGHGHGHAGEPHECPWSMRIALVVLALCSVAVGFLGVPPALHGGDLFGHWLEPVVGSVHAKPEPGQPAHHDPVEYVLMAGSVLVALFGIGLAVRIYKLRNGVPAKDFAEAHPDLYKLVLDKYRVDEMYDATVVQPLLAANECAGRFDNAVIDGAVNGAGTVAAGSSKGVGVFDNEVVDAGVNAAALATEAAGKRIRRLQTGNIKEYLTFALVGGLFVIAFFCVVLTWPGLSDRIRRFFGG
jgi:NADH-quinone oxidoreductase subunit L